MGPVTCCTPQQQALTLMHCTHPPLTLPHNVRVCVPHIIQSGPPATPTSFCFIASTNTPNRTAAAFFCGPWCIQCSDWDCLASTTSAFPCGLWWLGDAPQQLIPTSAPPCSWSFPGEQTQTAQTFCSLRALCDPRTCPTAEGCARRCTPSCCPSRATAPTPFLARTTLT